MTINILGAGAFGTALAISYAQHEDVVLWARSQEAADQINLDRENKLRLAGYKLPKNVSVTAQIYDLSEGAPCLLSIPMQSLAPFCVSNKTALDRFDLFACCKGVDLKSGLGPVGILNQYFDSDRTGILSGPSFARDLAEGLPTALTIAMSDAAKLTQQQDRLTTPHLRLYATTDIEGVELGGALKNVMAIACGVVEGAGLGESARAAILTRGFAEMRSYAANVGNAQEQTLLGLSGLGDLTLTASSSKSRNFRFGMAIGAREIWHSAETVEGAATACALAKIAQDRDLDLPLIKIVAQLVDGKLSVETALEILMARPLRKEN
ncbi:NAD(P)H-dependent glycerol-3-phosphate dehydrogenase [Nereida sp. MMG025]|uniref:NAD(P)H-dependent glycerol-3-phosphate dehydrogenase n=1 Tax=Nereida sp. MMG025 TaxID=2909981 RepID=UPI001F0295A9|nr:NAD(P)H-dependent glycerol-3-phosphate dehydrogenase [Nereida sp. MMG025]MCF6444651.1 NAD(P)H-dependent glycerol-3-phosphate dehydrogenase [Nereida sp. MMG025]